MQLANNKHIKIRRFFYQYFVSLEYSTKYSYVVLTRRSVYLNHISALCSSDMSAEKALIRRLMHNYQRIGRNGRPVLNISQAVPVTFGLGLINMDLDERNKVLTMSCWTRYVSITVIP